MGIPLAVPAETGTVPGRLRGPWSRSPDQGRGSPPELAGAPLVREGILGGEGRLGRLGIVPPVRLGDGARAAIRLRPMSPSTEDAYLPWIGGSYAFHGRRDPSHVGAGHVSASLPVLPTRGRVSASTQNQALAALPSLYRGDLGRDRPCLDHLLRARRAPRLPVVLSRQEVRALLSEMGGVPRLMATLPHGSGLRPLECCHLRVKDVDFGRNRITLRRGKGDEDRVTILPGAVRGDLAAHLRQVRGHHERDVTQGAGWVELPGALDRMLPSAGRDWAWRWVLPATCTYVDPETGQRLRYHLHETVVQHAVRRAVLAAGISKRAGCPPSGSPSRPTCSKTGATSGRSRSSPATRTWRRRSTTMSSTAAPQGVRSPRDRLFGEGP